MATHFTANAQCTIVTVRPADAGVSRIGHFGFFREQFRDTLWADALAWLDADSAVAAARTKRADVRASP